MEIFRRLATGVGERVFVHELPPLDFYIAGEGRLEKFGRFISDPASLQYLSTSVLQMDGTDIEGLEVEDPDILRRQGQVFSCRGTLFPSSSNACSVHVGVEVIEYNSVNGFLLSMGVETLGVRFVNPQEAKKRILGVPIPLERIANLFQIKAFWDLDRDLKKAFLTMDLTSPLIAGPILSRFDLPGQIKAMRRQLLEAFERENPLSEFN